MDRSQAAAETGALLLNKEAGNMANVAQKGRFVVEDKGRADDTQSDRCGDEVNTDVEVTIPGAIQVALVMDVLDNIADRVIREDNMELYDQNNAQGATNDTGLEVMVRTGEELTVTALSRFENNTYLKRYMRRNQDIERTLEGAEQQPDLTISDVDPDNELEACYCYV
ncbi:Hypothetical predicted protein [Olea europaea subsp. europaea]|uniref:Uncharacterized protein n=1 Tax=Olea europaea subsp. europaea TaxID=158383 RepID=A0A8S0PK16_OLEEU|nr:Hypothetical predicted protein [Olea europaea subsp. europaea]